VAINFLHFGFVVPLRWLLSDGVMDLATASSPWWQIGR
jgi:hypothetical protein